MASDDQPNDYGMGSVFRWLQQLRIVIRKDYVIAKRNYRSTIISILVPVIFTAFLVILQLAFNNNEKLSDLVKPVRTGTVTTISRIPRCYSGRSRADAPCITVAYSPDNDPNVAKIMDQIRTDSGLSLSDVKGFNTGYDLDRYLSEHPNSTQAAYNFFLINDGATPAGVRYVVQYNSTSSTFRGKTYDPMLNVLLPMQKAADIAIMKTLLTGRPVDVDYNFISFPHPETSPIDVAAAYGPMFFFGALMFNFVIQLGRLVSEKELNLRASMKLMGLRDSVYMTAGFIIVLSYNVISAMSLSLAGLAFQMKFFLKNDFGLYFVLFFLFGLAMTPLVLLLSVFVSKSRTATVLGFGVFLVGSIVQGFASLVFDKSVGDEYRIPFSFLPFALLSKGIGDLSAFSNTEDSPGLRWSQRGTNSDFFPLTSTFYWLLIDTGVFTLLAVYLDQVVPNDNGINQKPWFFLLPSYWFPKRVTVPFKADAVDHASHHGDVDEDVLQEMNDAMNPANDAPLRIINLQKTFFSYKYGFKHDKSKDFHAVRGVYLSVPNNTLFCLLGHNGAGKTTTLNTLTGLTKMTSGDALVYGKSINSSMSDVQKSMGVCPQYDILWAQMTAREHLELFAGLKQVPKHKCDDEVNERLKDVDLLSNADNLAGNFSGGMQRRLSVAIALIGDPRVVYLDEPTTGMDPVSRRKVWNLIERVKRNRITILTTHSMEEADILSDRIGIMHQGRFACLGNSLHLKQKYGSGYRITVLADRSKQQAIQNLFINGLKGCTLMGVEEGGQKFNVPRECTEKLPDFFMDLENRRKEFGIDDIQLSLSTLEEVFLHIGGLGETDERVGEQEGEEADVPPPTACGRFKKSCANNKIAYAVGVLVVLILLIIISAALKPAPASVADIVTYQDTKKYSDLSPSTWNGVESSIGKCSRGDSFTFFVKPGASNKLLIEFQGGGICWDANSCSNSFGTSTFNASITTDTTDALKFSNAGIFKTSDQNPFSGWTHLYIPLCTADSFLGNKTIQYDAGVELRHWGAINAKAALDYIVGLTPQKVVVAGYTNGAVGAAFHAQAIAMQFSNSDVSLLVDNHFDFSSNEVSGVPAMGGVDTATMTRLVGTAFNEWRLSAFSAWGVSAQSSVVPPTLVAATNNISLWSTEQVLKVIASQVSPKPIAIARFSSVNAPDTQTLTSQKILQSPSFLAFLRTMNVNVGAFAALDLTSLTCSLTKSVHTTMTTTAVTSGNPYAGFLGVITASAILDVENFYSETGVGANAASIKFTDWIPAFSTDRPLTLAQVFEASCPSFS
uniref:ABC transporter domain-containing protein n=1 Tax=Spongospora subterranea TaxID=70186 RepID=A0A0H5RMD2_9EUKA|eukprot:CRZ09879.1 hypothetical protein [Spongospora subterranea]